MAVIGLSSENSTTVSLPLGTSNHGNPDLICFPASWMDIVTFFLGNYVAHVVTTVTPPGLSQGLFFQSLIYTLVFPGIGVARGVQAILSFAIFADSDLDKAARAGALCRVVRKDQWARSELETRLVDDYKPSFIAKFRKSSIFGRYHLPPGYAFALVPRNARFERDGSFYPMNLSSQRNVIKICVSIAQLTFATFTLYNSRGDQVKEFGYAAFGLTATMYAVMSLLNLFGNVMCPQYSSVFMVSTSVMDEAVQNQGFFDMIVARLDDKNLDNYRDTRERSWANRIELRDLLWLPISFAPTALSLVVIWWMSGFKPGDSTFTQQFFTMSWLAIGSLVGIRSTRWEEKPREEVTAANRLGWLCAQIGILLVLGSFVGYAFYVVALEIIQFGICKS
ncbi:hypothetical protein NA57DRAFT_80148 [Rhizodiscina lignyota]|uniref:Uncharacterized protein n=1 Tax=Rhizodiscina lignyota TaxID=1504668 RepID=A0A9P4I7N9_9PEZI|nr:hypothetical protein NA57DRAFT_80148 [Rhizodiscina lignyota]